MLADKKKSLKEVTQMQKTASFISRGCLIGVVLFVTGCGSVSTSGYIARLSPPSPDKFSSAVDFANAYTGAKGVTNPDGVRSTRTRMCGTPFGASRKNLYLTGAGEICVRQGGKFQRPLCMDQNDENIIFVANTEDTPASSRTCDGSLEDFYVIAAEPVQTVQPREFTALISNYGYKKRAVIEAEAEARRKVEQNQLKMRMEEQALLFEAQRKAKLKDLPQIRKIGAQICKRGMVQVGYGQMEVVSVGFVEGITDDKVQIRVARAYFASTPSLSPGGFSPSIIWDYPMNWDLCW